MSNSQEWENFLKGFQNGTFYHSQKWKDVIRKSSTCYALYLTIKDSDGRLVGIFPAFIMDAMRAKICDSLPVSDYGGPLIMHHCLKSASQSLLSYLQDYCSDNSIKYVKIRLTDNDLVQHLNLYPSFVEKSEGVFEIDLKATPSDFIWRKIFSRHTRKKINQVERRGFQIREAKTKSDMNDFYRLHYQDMKYIGAAPFEYEFMANMWQSLYPENLRIWLIGKNESIGGITVLKYGQKTYWISVGINRKRAGSYSLVPSLVWREINKAEEEKYRFISLGATPSNPQHTSYLQKKSFGGSFYPQKIIWYPFSSASSFMLHSKAILVPPWNTFRFYLPKKFMRSLRHAKAPLR